MSDMTDNILQSTVGKLVYVKLTTGGYITGRLEAFDDELNLVLEVARDSKQTLLGKIF